MINKHDVMKREKTTTNHHTEAAPDGCRAFRCPTTSCHKEINISLGGGGESRRDHILFIERGREGESVALTDCKRGPWKTFVNEGDH